MFPKCKPCCIFRNVIIFIAYECIYEKFYKHTKNKLYMFNKLTSLGKTKNETTGILENPMSRVLGLERFPWVLLVGREN